MNILFTICGRAGSKGLKNKNLLEFLGYPLSFYTVSAIKLYKDTHPGIKTDIALNTDSKDLINLFKDNFDYIDIVKRSEKLGKDDTPKIDVIKETYRAMEDRNKVQYDMVVDLDLTSPLRKISDIEKIIDKKSNSNADVVFSVVDSRRNPYFNMVSEKNGFYGRVNKSDFNARQEAPPIYDMNASIYAYSSEFLEKDLNIFDGKCDITKMEDTGILDIDSGEDFELMEVIGDYLFKSKEEFKKVRDNIKNI